MKSSRTPPSLGPKWDFQHYGVFQCECNACKIGSSSAYGCNPRKLTDTLTMGTEKTARLAQSVKRLGW